MKKIAIGAATLSAIAALAYPALAADNGDPVLMTVNGKKILKSEFEYLYNKNNTQQQQPQSIDQYLQMFIDYKLKVADAEAEKLDTTAQFITEFKTSCDELAQPYLIDSTAMNQLIDEAYNRMKENVNVSHIMVYPGMSPAENDSIVTAMNGFRDDLMSGKQTWDDLVRKYSVDQGSRDRHGNMGWIVSGTLPYPFEKAAYDTEVHHFSPVVNSGFGYHIIYVNGRRPAPGEVKASHILKLTINKPIAEATRAQAQIDSLYALLLNGADFAELAKKNSDDGSAARGGDLGWFGPGRMVAEFDSVAFSLKDGEISKPFTTRFGYHIVKRDASRPVPSFEEARDGIISAIQGDERASIPYRKRMDQLCSQHNARLLYPGLDKAGEIVTANGKYDSTAVALLNKCDDVAAFEVGGQTYPVSLIMPQMTTIVTADMALVRSLLTQAASQAMELKVIEAERKKMIEDNPEYRNLVNEYRDGILLFDVSNRKVWDKATKDKDGLDKFFRKNRKNYRWESPKFKGYIVFAKNDSILKIAREYCDSVDNAPAFNSDEFISGIKSRLGRDVRVERVIAAQGENPITDFLAFGGQKPNDPKKIRWNDYFAFRGRIIEQPEEVADVRGAVVTDYQNHLEKEWLAKLHKKYKVKVDKKVLETIK